MSSAKQVWSIGKMIAICIAIIGIINAQAKNYFVSPDGSNSNPGSLLLPFQTIQKAADVMVAGDRCLIRRGVYRETVIPKNSGSSGSPIIYMPYNNERVVVSATEVISGWQKHDGNIYKAPMQWTLGTPFNQAFVNGEMALEARFPNINEQLTLDEKGRLPTGWAFKCKHLLQNPDYEPLFGTIMMPVQFSGWWTFNGHSIRFSPIRYSDDRSPAIPFLNKPKDFFKGGIYWGTHGGWSALSAYITASDDTSIAIKDSMWHEVFVGGPGRGMGYITGVFGLLDCGGEWYLDSAKKTLYFWPPDSGTMEKHTVEAKKRMYTFFIDRKAHIEIHGLYHFGGCICMPHTDNVLIDNCHMKYATHYTHHSGNWDDYTPHSNAGIYIQGKNITVRNSSIQYSAGGGIQTCELDSSAEGANQPKSENVTIESNLIRYIDYYGSYCAGVSTASKHGIYIRRNSIGYVGRSTININHGGGYYRNHNHDIQYNRLHDGMLIGSDGGVVYSYGVSARGTDFSYNWIYNNHNKQGGLLMCDLYGWDWMIHHNVFWHKDGINFRAIGATGGRNLIYNNTIIDTGWAGYEPSMWGFNHLYVNENPDSVGMVDPDNWNFSLTANSIAIDKGQTWIHLTDTVSTNGADTTWKTGKMWDEPYIMSSDVYTGDAPDLGAYEYGMPAWKAGHDWGEPRWEYPLKRQELRAHKLARVAVPVPRMRLHHEYAIITGAQWRLNVYSVGGRLVKSASNSTAVVRRVTVDMQDLAKGTYVAALRHQTGVKHSPFVKVR